MPRGSPLQTSFNAGELSPRLHGRVDVQKYASGLDQLENMICTVQGNAFARSGTRYVAENTDMTAKSRLIPFERSDTESYVMELSNLKARFFQDEAQVNVPTWPTVSVVAAADLATQQAHGMEEEAGPFWVSGTLPPELSPSTNYYAKNVTANTFQFSATPGGAVIVLSGTTYIFTVTPQVDIPYTIVTPYLTAELFDIDYALASTDLVLVHPDHEPAQIVITDASNNTIFIHSDLALWDGPYDLVNLDGNNTWTTGAGIVNGATGTLTMATAGTFDTTRDTGRIIRLFDSTAGSGEWYWLELTTFISGTQFTVTNKGPDIAGAVAAEPIWQFGLYYDANYPSRVSYHEQRLVFAGEPISGSQRFVGSVPGDISNFTPSGDVQRPIGAGGGMTTVVSEANSYNFTVASDELNKIEFLSSQRTLLIGTSGGLFPVQASSASEAVSPININARRSTSRGATPVKPTLVDDQTIFVSRNLRRIYGVGYAFQTDTYVPADITVLAEHITGDGVTDLQYAQEVESVLWAVREDGVLLGCTIDQQNQVTGWHRHLLGGTDVEVESIAVIPAPAGTPTAGAHENQPHDQLWMIVKRTIDGATTRYVEFLEDSFPRTAVIEDAFFVDSGITYSGVSTNTITGLDHLEAETVVVLADGKVDAEKVVASGQIVLTNAVTKAQVGLRYIPRMKTLPLENAGSQAHSQGKLKRVDSIAVRVDRSVGGQVARNQEEAAWDGLLYETNVDIINTDLTLQTKDAVASVDEGWDFRSPIILRQFYPLPLDVLLIAMRSQGTERGFE